MSWSPRPWFWGVWLAAIVLTFAVPEIFALVNNGTTFSSFMAGTQTKWPLWELVWGLVIGGVGVHCWWHWVPPGSKPDGG